MKRLLLILIFFLVGCQDNLTINQITFNNEIKYKVTIEGHVNKPGLYLVDHKTKIEQLIKLAGGYQSSAEKLAPNLVLKDNLKLFVNSNRIKNKLNLNTCSTSQLQTIKGIGPALANKIIVFRQKYDNFKILSDLLLIKGIKEKKFKLIYEYLKIE